MTWHSNSAARMEIKLKLPIPKINFISFPPHENTRWIGHEQPRPTPYYSSLYRPPTGQHRKSVEVASKTKITNIDPCCCCPTSPSSTSRYHNIMGACSSSSSPLFQNLTFPPHSERPPDSPSAPQPSIECQRWWWWSICLLVMQYVLIKARTSYGHFGCPI